MWRLFEQARVVDRGTIRLIPGSGVDCRRFVPQRAAAGAASVSACCCRRGCCGTRGWPSTSRRPPAACGRGRAIDFLLAGDPDPGNPATVPEHGARLGG